MERFIDRENELARLEREYAAPRASMVVLYGRRRVGKTALLQEFIRDKRALYFLATEESETQNRNAFREAVAEFLNDSLLREASVSGWPPLFERLAQGTAGQKLVLVIDEFQYLGSANAAFPSVVQKVWDTLLAKANVMLVLCGSLITMMESQTLHYSSPLYGRRTAQIKLKPIPYRYYHEFYPALQGKQLVEHYAVTGGVPKYIELFGQEADIYQSISEHILETTGFLYEEPTFLLQNEVSEIGNYFSIIKAIAAGNTKLSKIATVMEVPQTSLSKYLHTLIELDILEREIPVIEPNPEKSKKGLYKIKDNFLRFWFRFVYPSRSYLERGEQEFVLRRIRQNFVDGHAAYVFEDICRELLWEKGAADQLPFLPEKVGRWWDNANNEIDAVALSENGGENDLLLGECKYWKEPVGANVLAALEQKAALVNWHKENYRVWFALFSASGFTQELQALAARRRDVLLLELES